MGMTGHQLLAALSELPFQVLEQEVSIEGCDCWGDVGSVEIDIDGTISLYRATNGINNPYEITDERFNDENGKFDPDLFREITEREKRQREKRLELARLKAEEEFEAAARPYKDKGIWPE